MAADDVRIETEAELQKYSAGAAEEFRRAHESLAPRLSEADLATWGQYGLDIARQSIRSWEAAVEFLKASPAVAHRFTFADVKTWADSGVALSQDSPAMAAAYFKATPGVLGFLSPRVIPQWADLGRRLFVGTWKSSALAAKFFESSPQLLQHLNPRDFYQFLSLINLVARKSYDLATECLIMAPQVLPQIEGHHQPFLSLSASLVERHWREIRGVFEAVGQALPQVDRLQRGRYIALTENLVRHGLVNAPGFLQETARAFAKVSPTQHGHILTLAGNLLSSSAEAVPDFLRNLPDVQARVTPEQLEAWFNEGLAVLRDNGEGGRAFFRLETSRAKQTLERLSSSVELEMIKDLIGLYCRALTGLDVEIHPAQELVDRSIGWVSEQRATTEGTNVFLPDRVDRYVDKGENFSWYKVMSTHQTAHLEFASFDFDYDRPSILFKDLRPLLALGITPTAGQLPGAGLERGVEAGSAEHVWLTGLQRYFDLFGDRWLSLDLFTVFEDQRVDTRVSLEYRGLKNNYANVQEDALRARPILELLPAREALVEFLARLSLQPGLRIPVPKSRVKEARALARISRRMLHPEALVEDTSEATLRAYSIIAQIPNEAVPEDEWEALDTSDSEDDQDLSEEELDKIVQEMLSQQKLSPEEGQSYLTEVEYRGDFKPELSQLLNQLRDEQFKMNPGEEGASPQDMLEELLEQSVEVDLEEGDTPEKKETFATNIMKEAGVDLQQSDTGYGAMTHVDEDGGPLEATEPRTAVYPEWDFRANDFKPAWCMVREQILTESDSHFFNETLAAYGVVAAQIKREFEQISPEMMRKERRVVDGEDLDIDAVIEAVVDKRTGNTPSEKIYWRRNKVERDVAVAFLLDMSASTAEAIDESRRVSDDWDAPEDPVEYMVWLRNRRGNGVKRTYKRIIDLEKESIVLLINALEAIGDVYGIYGFSGYGRENVEFYVIKDLEERLTDRVKRRIDKVSPLHATRMGPAIRHTTSKLESVDARTKFLFLISDGRPQDRGYSREGVEKEYAVHDTRTALMEAKQVGVTPFCLTVDKQGHDYLKTMMQDMSYEILWDIRSLPARLPRLYRRLTI